MPSRVDIKEKRWVLDDFFKVEEAHLSFERFDGTMSPVVRRLNFERGDSVAAMLHHTERGTALLVNQFKYPSYEKGPGWITEVVAGMIDKGETPEEAIQREIHQETGYTADRVEHISTFYVSPGGSSERIMLIMPQCRAPGQAMSVVASPARMRTSSSLKFPLLMHSVSCDGAR